MIEQGDYNVLDYIKENVKELTLIKAIYILYLLDEYSVKKCGVPTTWFDYSIENNKPMIKELSTLDTPTNKFDDGECSDFQMELMKPLIKKHKNKSIEQLEKILLNSKSTWTKIVRKKELENSKKKKEEQNNEINIPLMINTGWFEIMAYKSAVEARAFEKAVNNFKT